LDKQRLSAAFPPNAEDDDPDNRVVNEKCRLVILKAILQRGGRKWEFVWRGVKINAPVVDNGFYDKFDAHRITIAPGDELDVDLAIRQTKDGATGIYTNDSYVVVKVHEHISAIRQKSFDGR
jgi:hypothetical protein